MDDDDAIIAAVIKREGSAFTDDPNDLGGPTKFGITAALLSDYLGRTAMGAEIANLTLQEAQAIYREMFFVRTHADLLGSVALRGTLVDYAVNCGPDRAIRALQRVLGVTVDGKLGPKTAAAANVKDGRRVSLLLLADRERHNGRMVTDDAHWRHRGSEGQAANAAGWASRVAEQIEVLA